VIDPFLKRTPIKKRYRRRGRVSKAGQITLIAREWKLLVEKVWEICGGRCEQTMGKTRCPARATDPHHLIYRSQGGSDTIANVFGACRYHHNSEHDGKIKFVPFPHLGRMES